MPANATYPLAGTVLEVLLDTSQLRVKDDTRFCTEWLVRPNPNAEVPAITVGDFIIADIEDVNQIDSPRLPFLYEGTACSIRRLFDAEDFAAYKRMEDLNFEADFEGCYCEPDDPADPPYFLPY